MGSEIPEWAMEEAGRLTNKTPQYSRQVLDVARALVAAERRGIGRAAKAIQDEAAKPHMDGCSASYAMDDFVAAIRQLGDTP